MTAPTPGEMRALADAAGNLTRDNDWDSEVIADVMAALRAAADQLEATQWAARVNLAEGSQSGFARYLINVALTADAARHVKHHK